MNPENKIETAVILAAGWGSRIQGLGQDDRPVSKPLIPLNGQAMVVRVMRCLATAGISKVIIVTGYLNEHVEQSIEKANRDIGLELQCAFNPKWDTLANGVSLLAARPYINGPFLLSMSDHVFDIEIPTRLIDEGPGEMGVRLCIDRKIDTIFDIDDATKVMTEGEKIIAIDKQLESYNAIDIGLFSCREEILDHLETALQKNGDCSLSDGMRMLGESGRFGYMDIGNALWQDVDTPETLEYAKKLIDEGRLRFPA